MHSVFVYTVECGHVREKRDALSPMTGDFNSFSPGALTVICASSLLSVMFNSAYS